MFGLPGQTDRSMARDPWRKQSRSAGAYFHLLPDVRRGHGIFPAPCARRISAGSDADAEFFEMTMAILKDAGYEHYEISNYAHPGFESVHNRAYWSGNDYLGLGPSAVSTMGMQRLAKRM
jgi:coproporphyrinogen III oxidase-like Fe-S oxidoreductase